MLTPKFDTCFFERYAMVSLATLLGDHYAHLVNRDRPDLQDETQSIGIEVTLGHPREQERGQCLGQRDGGRGYQGSECGGFAPHQPKRLCLRLGRWHPRWSQRVRILVVGFASEAHSRNQDGQGEQRLLRRFR